MARASTLRAHIRKVICQDIDRSRPLSQPSQNRAVKAYRERLGARGLTRFEVLAPTVDRDLIRGLAKRLSEDGPDAARVRATLTRTVIGEPPEKGGILAALRRSPLVGAELDLTRSVTSGRIVDL